SGNLMLHIPLGSLGPDRVGASHGIALIYNSKIWESATVSVNQTPARGIQAANPLAGGWHYEAGYDLEVSLRSDDFSECVDGQPPSTQEFSWAFKTHIVFPDGSRHLLRLKGAADLNG